MLREAEAGSRGRVLYASDVLQYCASSPRRTSRQGKVDLGGGTSIYIYMYIYIYKFMLIVIYVYMYMYTCIFTHDDEPDDSYCRAEDLDLRFFGKNVFEYFRFRRTQRLEVSAFIFGLLAAWVTSESEVSEDHQEPSVDAQRSHPALLGRVKF